MVAYTKAQQRKNGDRLTGLGDDLWNRFCG